MWVPVHATELPALQDESVDVQLVVSAGMNIASGPVCTAQGGPVFLADGFARTEVSLNPYGHGRIAAPTPDHRHRFNVGSFDFEGFSGLFPVLFPLSSFKCRGN